ncbi:glycosyltransferase [Microbispora sp. H11081]|uniref:bifunctional glycosyltransferase/CDP-glycerol:glycerophosphate glycerophosphotransferase n=1 Tax=Microbispora sp. H11081 TaxID=2729107 RepID=UPI001476785F|nr:glycosyltransferase [Microbispora sp. H11081]
MPRLSVIVPIYDVEPYLAGCLASVAAQTWEDVEVVMVDDGSPDGSAAIAAGFAARDDRFRLVSQANAGLGAARNTGVRHATGDYLMFLDSDDLLPAHALEHLMASLERTGSDLATGNVLRLDARGARQSAMHRAVFADAAAATHITRTRTLLRDRLVTNKLWRRSFWDAHGFAFPEGVLYEDIAVALRAHFLARSVDVLPSPVYVWRRREDGGRSITQDKARTAHLEDRFAAVTQVRRFLSQHHFTAHIHAWDHAVLDGDLTNFLDVLDQGTAEFRERFLDLAGRYLEDVAPPVLDGLPALRRLQWHLVRLRRLTDLLDVLAWDREVRPDRRLVRRMGGHHLNVSLPRSADIPATVTKARDELVPRHRIDAVRWEDGVLVVEGRAAPPYLRPTRRVHQQVFATLVHERTGRRVRVPASVTRARISTKSKERDWGGFRLAIDPAALARPGRLGRWHVELRVLHRGALRRGRLTDPRVPVPIVEGAGYRAVGPDHYVAPLLGETGDLVLRAERETARVVTHEVRDGRLRLVGHVVNDLGPSPVLQVTRRPGGVPRTCPVHVDGRTFEAVVDLRDLLPPSRAAAFRELVPAEVAAPEAWWEVTVVAADGAVTPVTLAEDVPTGRYGLAGREMVVSRDGTGGLVLRDQAAAAYADLAEWLPGGELLLEGGLTVPHEMSALVVTALDAAPWRGERLLPIEGAGSRFRARLTPERVCSAAGPLPLPRGRYALSIRARAAGGGWTDLPLELDTEVPAPHQTARRTFGIATSGPGRAVLTVSGDLTADERGRKAQRVLRATAYPQMRDRSLRDAVLFDGGAGTRFGGSPRAVCEELRRRGADLPLLWNVRDGQVALPGDVEAVRTLGREHYEALARCRYVVTDAPLPRWFRRRPGQVVLQTWQGSAHGGGDARDDVGAGQWTHLLSPGPRWTPSLRGTPGFGGQVWETGLPCDDLLTGPGAEERAAEVRRRLGLPEPARVVLYVAGEHDTLDAGRLADGLPEDHVLLVRRLSEAGPDEARLRDVTGHPDPHELYLAADVLVAGDVAAVFDFAVTGRPVLLHAGRPQDLWLLPEAPGPALRREAEVLDAVAHLDEVADKHRDAHAAFLARHRPMADGRAACRVVDGLFG